MIKKLIINADDFGMCEGNTLGILLGHEKGLISSTTVMMNMPYAKWALDQAKRYPDLGIGVHLTLTMGKPLLPGKKSYTDDKGYFLRPSAYEDGFPDGDPDEVYTEWKAQIEAFIQYTGHLPTHLDSHHHVHMEHRQIDVIQRLAEEYHLPIRQTKPIIQPFFPAYTNFYGEGVNFETFKKICSQDEYETVEIMSHPALIDERLMKVSSYNLPRMKELALLMSDSFKQFIDENNIQLISYADIKNK